MAIDVPYASFYDARLRIVGARSASFDVQLHIKACASQRILE
jgi:hypothetical protein